MGARWNTGRLLRIVAGPLLLAGVLTGLGSTAAGALTCQAWTGGQPASPGGLDRGDTLGGVAVLAACNVWVAGVTGGRTTLIEHWTGGSNWTVVPSPNPGGDLNILNAIGGSSPTDIWAVGADSSALGSSEQSLILHWNGKAWTQLPSPSPGAFTELTSVHAISASDAWAVGRYSTDAGSRTLTLHWDGTGWIQVANPGPVDAELDGVTATSGGDVWAVGDYLSNPQDSETSTLALHWDGTSWKQVASPSPLQGGIAVLDGVTATSPSDAWAVGHFSDGEANQTLIEHWDGKAWIQVTSPNPLEDDNLTGVAATSPGNAIAVGSGQAARKGTPVVFLALRWNGTAWSPVPTTVPPGGQGTNNVLAAVAAGPSGEVWAAGHFGPAHFQALAFPFRR